MGWDLMVAHPPCTYLCNSGIRWMYREGSGVILDQRRVQNMALSVDFFKRLLHAPIKRIAIENPIMHKYALEMVGRKPTQIIQPWHFGLGEVKTTWLWLEGLPKLKFTKPVTGREERVHMLGQSEDRWKERSRTPLGVAVAMATQWG
jgi:hypothetical protein